MTDTSPLPFNAVAPMGATPNITTNESPADISTTLAQATSIANMGGPGKNAAKAQQWLEGKLAAGATNDAEDAGKPLPFNSVKPISASAGKALPFNSVKPVSAAPTAVTKTPSPTPLLPSQPMTAQDVQTYSKLFHNPTLSGGGQVRMENWGFSPQQTAPSWNPRQAGALPTSYKGWNPIKMWMKNSLPANVIKSGKYAPQIEQAKYEIVQSYNKAEDVVNNPAKYTPQQVQAAAAYMKAMDKNAHQSVAAGFKEFYHNLSVAGLVKGLITDPELLLPVFGESGGMLKAGLEAGGINTALTGAQELTTAQGLNPAQLTVAGTVGGVVGGALHGAVHTAGDALGKIIPKREPGEPLPPTTPIDKTGNVPYTGGVTHDGSRIPIHKGFPDTLSMKNEDGHEIEIPVTQIVAHVHEAEEWPLMHPESPVPMGKVLEMKERAGNPTDDTFTPKIMKDIQDGTPLSYQDAHAIATAIENKYVHDHYGVDPKVYQDALKPYIKEAGKTSEAEPASNIPADLDTKPYEDAGHPEILKGKGDRPAVDGVSPGAKEGEDTGQPGAGSPGSPENNGFLHGPEPGDRYRVGASSAMGGALSLETDSVNGRPRRTNYIGVDGELISADKINLANHAEPGEGRDQLWIPDTPEKAAQAKAILDELGRTGPAGDGYVDLLDRLHELVTGNSPKMPENGSVGIDNANTPITDKDISPINARTVGATALTLGAGAGVGAYAAGPGHRKAGAVAGGLAGLFAGINVGGEDIGPGNKQRGMMAGRRAVDADKEQLDRAILMEKYGIPMETIRQKTGWMRTPHGDLQHEISDHDSHIAPLTNMDVGKTLPMDKVLKHPTLYKNYPFMKDWKVHIDPELEVLGQVNPITKTIRIQPAENYPKMGDQSLRAVMHHEAQHIVQEAEGFPRGASSKAYLAEHLNNGTPNPERAAAIDYWHTAGEVQARDTSSRMGLTPEERRMIPPDPSIPWEKQVVKRDRIANRDIANNELPPLESLKDNYRKDLSTYTPEVYRETNGEGALALIPGSPIITTIGDIYTSSHPDTALGQGTNRGILLSFDASKLQGQIDKNKPSWEFSWGKGYGEFISRHNTQRDYQEAVTSITLKPDLRVGKVQKIQLQRTLSNLEKRGWEKQINTDGSITYHKPNESLQSNNESIADHLQKTGEMDEEGNLHGMILPEDHLPNESDIVEKAKGGDQQAITSLYKKYMPRLTRSLYGMMRQAGPRLGLGPEDIANEAFFQAMRNLHNFKGNSAFYTWLHTIGRNTALNAIEKGDRQVPTTSMFDSPPERENTQPIAFQGQVPGKEQSLLKPSIKGMVSEEDTPEHMLEAHEVSNMVKYAISKLPNEIRDAIKMKEFEGLTEQEIADKQGVPVGTVKSRLFRGREMLKESIRKGHGATFRKQMGGVTFDQTKRLGLLAGGAAAGYAFGGQQHHVRDAILGAMAGIGAGAITFHGIVNTIKDARSASTTPRVSPILDQLGGSLAVEGRHIDALVKAIKLLQGDNSYDIAHALEGDKTVQLTPAQQAIKEQVQSAYRYVSWMAKVVGLNMKELGDYTTHIFAKTKENQDRLEEYAQMQASAPSTTSPFARPRVGPPTLRRALASGLTLKHDNFADSLGEYLNSMMTALHTKAAINQMKLVKDESGVPVLVKSGKAPYGYVTSNHPALRGLAMHPGIATEVSHLFDTYSPTLVARRYRIVNNFLKRVWFSYNFFHGQTFMDVQSGNSLNPIKNLRTDIKAITGTTDFHKAIANPTKGDVVDKVLSHGGTVGTRTGGFTEDVGSTLDPMFNFMEEHLNKTIPGLGLLPKGLKAVDHAFQTLIFKNMGNGFKGTAAQIAHDILESNWIKKAQEDPTTKIPDDHELWRQAVSFSSVSFGGLDWRTLANQCTNKYMRSILMHVGSPAGRRSLQLAFAAPDWLASTTAHWTKAIFGEGTGLKGIISPRNAVDLHRAWLARSVMGYMVYANGLNMAFTGHPIWDNKDPFMVSLGEGRKMQWMKELTDFPRMLANPAQEFLNKLAPTPKITGEQVLDKQYLSAKGHAPSMTSLGQRLQVAAKGVSPIFSTQVSRGGPVSVISNLLGKPIYGTDPQAKERLKEKAKEKSAATRRMHEMAKYGG